jgi:hypothetical protein
MRELRIFIPVYLRWELVGEQCFVMVHARLNRAGRAEYEVSRFILAFLAGFAVKMASSEVLRQTAGWQLPNVLL